MKKTMAIAELSPAKYGKLLSVDLPKVIETRAEFDRAVRLMEALDLREVRGETAMQKLSSYRARTRRKVSSRSAIRVEGSDPTSLGTPVPESRNRAGSKDRN